MTKREIRVHFQTFPEDHLWVGECIELDIASSGESEDEALRNAIEATSLYLDTMDEKGKLEEFLREHGMELHEHGQATPRRIEERTILVGAGV